MYLLTISIQKYWPQFIKFKNQRDKKGQDLFYLGFLYMLSLCVFFFFLNFNLYLQFWFLKCPSDILFGYLTDISIYMFRSSVQFSSFQLLSRVWFFATPWIAACQASLSITDKVHSNSCPSSQWCHPTISSSVVPNPSQHQSLFQWVNSSHEVAKVLEFQL